MNDQTEGRPGREIITSSTGRILEFDLEKELYHWIIHELGFDAVLSFPDIGDDRNRIPPGAHYSWPFDVITDFALHYCKRLLPSLNKDTASIELPDCIISLKEEYRAIIYGGSPPSEIEVGAIKKVKHLLELSTTEPARSLIEKLRRRKVIEDAIPLLESLHGLFKLLGPNWIGENKISPPSTITNLNVE